MATHTGSKSLTLIEQQMAQRLADVNKTVGSGSGAQKLTIKNGDFIHADGRNLGNDIRFVVVDYISANRWYPHTFNKDNILPPGCIAFGRELAEMGALEESPEPQGRPNDPDRHCVGCPMNEWKSDPNGGNGKACKNSRELALILEEDIDEEAPQFLIFSVPPTSLGNFDSFVKHAAKSYGALPVKMICRAYTELQGTYSKIIFEATGEENPKFAEHYPAIEDGTTEDLLARVPDFASYVPSDVRPGRKPAAATTARAPRAATR